MHTTPTWRSRLNKTLLSLILTTGLFQHSTGSAQASEPGPGGISIRFQGTAHYINGFSLDSKDYQFSGLLSPNHWRIKIFPSGRENELGHVEYGFDGTNQFLLEFVNVAPYSAAIRTSDVFINGNVSKDGIPTSLTSFIHVYWLAYKLCATEGKETLPATLPASMLSGPSNSNVFEVRYTKSPDGSVQRVELWNPGLTYGTSGKTYKKAPPYDKGFTAAAFSVAERKQIGPWSVPSVCEWTIFMPSENGQSPNDLQVIHRLVLKTEQIEQYHKQFSAAPSPPLGQKIVIKDYRLAALATDSDALYISTNGFWAPEDKSFKERAKEVAMVKQSSDRRDVVSRIVLIGFVAFTALAAFLLFRKAR
jgi:hypothetical protein